MSKADEIFAEIFKDLHEMNESLDKVIKAANDLVTAFDKIQKEADEREKAARQATRKEAQ